VDKQRQAALEMPPLPAQLALAPATIIINIPPPK
jgi:hypothetical protein